MISEFGEITMAFSNMKKAYDFLAEREWTDKVNYSYFSRIISTENNQRFWEYKPIKEFSRKSKVRFIPIKIY